MNSFLTFIAGLLLVAGCGSGLKKQMVSNPASQADKDKNAILEYAIANKLKAEKTESGIYYVIDTPGDGVNRPKETDLITAHYHGTKLDGTVFDSSVDRGTPFQFSLNGVVEGWKQSIPLLTKGGKGKFLIPSGLAYGERGAGAKIPPNTPLYFEIELIDFQDPTAAKAAMLAKETASIEEFATKNELKLEKTDGGVYYHMTKKGTGTEHPTAASTVKVHYHGTLLDGTVFDSSVDRGKPIEFPLNRVIPGWTDAIPVLTEGGKAKLIIPSAMAYGPRSPSPKIPANSILVFDVELIEIK